VKNMAGHSLENIASFVRDLGGACSSILMKNDFLFAGSHDGMLICWNNNTGDELWRSKVTGPINDIALDENMVLITASANIHAFNLEDGLILWSRELEGASDFVVVKDSVIWASSSVYELEVADFIESTIWNFNKNGDEVERWVIEERPWILGLNEKEEVLLGLGRPRCGYIRIRIGQKPEHIILETDSPVTCGCCNSPNNFVFGHANGSVSVVNEEKHSTYSNDDQSLITAVMNFQEGWIAGNENGILYAHNQIKTRSGSIDALAECSGYAWASSWNGRNSTLLRWNLEGNELEISHDSRLRQICSYNEKLVLGDYFGRVFLVENNVLERRVKIVAEDEDEQIRNSELRARLRMLRNQ
tara:strand:+ start:232 stop:1308 length:1077 start_codon:yes stop_codon:yes gene_type:complete